MSTKCSSELNEPGYTDALDLPRSGPSTDIKSPFSPFGNARQGLGHWANIVCSKEALEDVMKYVEPLFATVVSCVPSAKRPAPPLRCASAMVG